MKITPYLTGLLLAFGGIAIAGGNGTSIACKYGFNIKDSQGNLIPVQCNGANDAWANQQGVTSHKEGNAQCDTVTVKVDGVNVNVKCGKVSAEAPE
jgi:hypothetical protein